MVWVSEILIAYALCQSVQAEISVQASRVYPWGLVLETTLALSVTDVVKWHQQVMSSFLSCSLIPSFSLLPLPPSPSSPSLLLPFSLLPPPSSLLQSCLQEKDYLNYRFFHKRSLFLSRVAAHLKQSGLCADLQFSTIQGDPLRPILCLTPNGAVCVE